MEVVMNHRNQNYANDGVTNENYNDGDKYSLTGESAFSRNMSKAFDSEDEFFTNNFDDGLGKSLKDISDGQGAKYIRPDIKIREDAIEALGLTGDPIITGVNVSVEDGIATLEGEVETRSQRFFTERLIGLVPGVLNVKNLLTLR